jgi:hypothetical protein
MKDRYFEILMLITSIVGLLIFFTLLYAGPKFVYNQILGFLK